MIRGCELQVDKVWKFVFEASFSWPSQRPIHPFCFVSELNGAFDNYSPSKRLFRWNSTLNFVKKISRYSWNTHRTESGYNFFNRNGFVWYNSHIGFTFFFVLGKKVFLSLRFILKQCSFNFSNSWHFLNDQVKVDSWFVGLLCMTPCHMK